jgi:hypothetical protein
MVSSFDPRESIRQAIGTQLDYNQDNVDEWVIQVTDDWQDTVSIPLLLPGETRTSDMYTMPYIEMVLVSAPAAAHNINGNRRKEQAYIDFNIWYTNTDNITPTTFGKTIADKLVSLIHTNRHNVGYFLEVINDGREIIEEFEGKQVIFHRIVEVAVINYE